MHHDISSLSAFSAAMRRAEFKEQERDAAQRIVFLQRDGVPPEEVEREWQRVGLPVINEYRLRNRLDAFRSL